MTRYEPGDVVLVRFPFTDFSVLKKRPALILSPAGYSAQDVVVLAMTSQPQRDKSLRLAKWKEAGLPKPTWFKPVLGTIAVSLVLRRLGQLAEIDWDRAKAALKKAIAPEFFSE